MTDETNLRLLEKLANKLVDVGTDAEEIFNCFKQAYALGKTMGHIEGSDAATERICASLSRIGSRME
jgi:hypothetical protein